MNKFINIWQSVQTQGNVRYKCGYCGTDTSPSKGWNTDNNNGQIGYVLICTFCNKPSFVETKNDLTIRNTPAVVLGNKVSGLPDEIEKLYDEARKCTSINANTSAVLTCRKILMHVSVEKGAQKGKSFIEYVNFLADNNYIPQDGKEWVDHIRSKSNEANHEIVIMGINDSDDLINFTEMLLRIIYEFKHRLKKDSIVSPTDNAKTL
jgi:hypothetical protein